jgi:hypothetical protein
MSFNEKEYQRQYRLTHKNKKKEYNRIYGIKHRDTILKQHKEYHKNNYIPHPQNIVRVPLDVRFWNQVNKGTMNECWNWTGVPNMWGYGQIREEGGRNAKKKLAHRISWIIHNGTIPTGMLVLHTCDNPLCVNPNHLWLGTHQDNIDDMMRKGRHGKCYSKMKN